MPFILSCLATFGWARFPCATREKHNAEFTKVGENSDLILSRLWTKVHEIFRRYRKPLILSNALFRFSVSRFIQKIFAIKSRSHRKTEQMQIFLPPIFVGGTAPTFLRQFVMATYYPLLGKVWLSSVCSSPSAKRGDEAECRIYGEWVKMAVEFEAVCGPKFMPFWDRIGNPL